MSGLAPVPRIALNRGEAAEALGISLSSFERHFADAPTIRKGKLRLYPVDALRRHAESLAEELGIE